MDSVSRAVRIENKLDLHGQDMFNFRGLSQKQGFALSGPIDTSQPFL